jgi:hypothetical protein
MTQHHSDRFHTFNLLNIALGAVVFAIAVYLTVTGEYDNLLLRQQAETLLGKVEVGALLYTVLFWYLDRFFRPLWSGAPAQQG